MNIRIRIGALAAAATVIFTVANCGTASTANTQVVGGSASTGQHSYTGVDGSPSASAAASMPAAASGPHNGADITFAQMMTGHHQGAIAMADLAPSRAASSQVKDLAAKIKAAQGPEIDEMSGWLTTWMPGMASASSSATGGMSGMDHGNGSAASMPGMMSDQQMNQLTAANGAAFDKLFLQLMISHHQGALTMAKTETASGKNPAALALATSITTSQSAEITEMQSLLKGL